MCLYIGLLEVLAGPCARGPAEPRGTSISQYIYIYIYIYIYSWMYKPTRSDSYPNPLRLTECLLSLTESY